MDAVINRLRICMKIHIFVNAIIAKISFVRVFFFFFLIFYVLLYTVCILCTIGFLIFAKIRKFNDKTLIWKVLSQVYTCLYLSFVFIQNEYGQI